jgi:PAS domain S-box-containing protein
MRAAFETGDALFRGLLESAPDAMVIVDASSGQIVLVNAQTERLFGYPRAELVGQSVVILVPQDIRSAHAAHRDGLAGEARARMRDIGEQLRARRKDGSEFPAEIFLSPLTTEDVMLVSAAVRDISDRVAIETELRRHRDRLEEFVGERTAALVHLNQELESFSYSVSHDLRAPLRSLDGFSQALIEDHAAELGDQTRDYLSRIRRAAQRMTAMLDGLLTLSHDTRGEIACVRVDLSALARDIADQLQQTDPGRRVQFRIASGLAAQADPNLLRVALQNLLGNAWKFTTGVDEALIEVGATELDGAPAWFVRDNGSGFDMTYADRLFGAFQRLHTQDQFPGTGIGLATVRRVVHRHGGLIAASAAPGAGATFTFTLAPGGREAATPVPSSRTL